MNKSFRLPDPGRKFEAKKRIEAEILPTLRRHETEYAQILSETVDEEKVSETQSQALVAELLAATDRIEGRLDAPKMWLEQFKTSSPNSLPPAKLRVQGSV